VEPPSERLRAEGAALRQATTRFFLEAREAVKASQPAVPLRPGRDEPVILDAAGRALPGVIALAQRSSELTQRAASLGRELEAAAAQLPLEADSHAEREFDLFTAQLKGRVAVLEQAFQRPSQDRLYWVGIERRSGRALVQAAPTAAGQLLQARAFAGKETVIFTSASLAVAESFDYFKRGVGLEMSSTHEMVLASPFDYLSQALLCLPTDLRELNDPAFVDQVTAIVANIAETIQGRTLVLFTAHQQLRDVAERLRTRVARSDLRVLAQNIDGTRRQLLTEFQQTARTILLGTSSFWEGIDVPGDALSCVVIVRLPFKVPTDPLQLARSATLADPFAQLALPEAVLRLKQGFGRLIRRRSDRGAVVLLDHRVANRTYGRVFLDALPRAEVHLGSAEELAPAIAQWLRLPRRAAV